MNDTAWMLNHLRIVGPFQTCFPQVYPELEKLVSRGLVTVVHNQETGVSTFTATKTNHDDKPV